METTVLPLIAQLGIGGIFLVCLWIVYNDGKKERAYMMDLLTKMYLLKLTELGEKPEDHADTLMKRP